MERTKERGRLARTAQLLAAFVLVSAVGGAVASGLVVPVTAAVGGAVTAGASLLTALPASMSPDTLAQTSVMLAGDGSPIAYFYAENRTQVPLAQISPLVQQAVVAVEDERFYDHGAVDPRGLVRAVVNDATGGTTQGASTLAQQYVKNAFLEQAVADHDTAQIQAATAPTAARKIKELRTAITVEQDLTKPKILERYLNIAYFGELAYGVEAASMRYFRVPAARLTLPQAALLAGLVNDPSSDDPVLHSLAAQTRRNLVLGKMLTQKMITPAQYTAAVATAVKVVGSPLPNGCDPAGSDGFFCEYVVRSVLTDPAYAMLGATAAQREARLLTGGLVIRTTLDPRTQEGAVHAVDKAVPPTDASGLATAAVTVEPGTGAVVAMAQDRTYSTSGRPGTTTVNYSTDSVLGGSQGFQTGSSFKPFTLAAWLAAGNSLGDTVDATKRAFASSDFEACGHRLAGGAPYTPGNSEGTETGPMSVLTATADSVNVAYVDMESQLDLCTVASTAQSLGVHLAAPANPCGAAAASTALPTCLPSLTLGVENIAPLTMAAAYAGFATGGTWCAPLPIRSITKVANPDTPARTIATYAPQCRQALTRDVAAGVNAALETVLTDGTAATVGPLDPWTSAGKTGTTDGPYDTWFVGYTAQRATAVWVGDPGHVVQGELQRRRLTDIEVGGHWFGTVFGASIAAPIWKSVMTTAMHGLPAERLAEQRGGAVIRVGRPSASPSASPSVSATSPSGSTPGTPTTPPPSSGPPTDVTSPPPTSSPSTRPTGRPSPPPTPAPTGTA